MRAVRFMCAASAVVLLARPAGAADVGRIEGAIVTSSSPTYPADVLGIRENVRIVARTADGTSVGTFVIGKPQPESEGEVRVPYTIVRVPTGVSLRISAERFVAVSPSPEPSGFFMSFVAQKRGGDPATPFWPVTLAASHPVATGCDFRYAPIEVPPMPPAATAQPRPSPANR